LKSWWDYLAGKALEVTGWSKKLTYSGWFVGINSLHQAKMRIATAALGGSRKHNTVAIMEKITKPPFRATARDRTDPTSRFEQTRNLKSPTLKPRNPRVASAGVPWGSLKVAARRSARDDNQKSETFLIIADWPRLSNPQRVVLRLCQGDCHESPDR